MNLTPGALLRILRGAQERSPAIGAGGALVDYADTSISPTAGARVDDLFGARSNSILATFTLNYEAIRKAL